MGVPFPRSIRPLWISTGNWVNTFLASWRVRPGARAWLTRWPSTSSAVIPISGVLLGVTCSGFASSYDAYKGQTKVSALLTQLPWTHHLVILGRSKRPEEREFYIRIAAQERWSSRELERQINSALFERVVLSPAKLSAPLRELHPDAASIFKDAYLVEFADLPPEHTESALQRALIEQLRPLGKKS